MKCPMGQNLQFQKKMFACPLMTSTFSAFWTFKYFFNLFYQLKYTFLNKGQMGTLFRNSLDIIGSNEYDKSMLSSSNSEGKVKL